MTWSESSFSLPLFLLSTIFYSFKTILNGIVLVVLVTFSVILVYPLLLVIFVPTLLYRKIAVCFVQIWDSKCGGILSGMDATMAGKDPYNKSIITLSPYFIFNDKLERSHIVKVLNEQIIKPNLFPNLKQKIVRKIGYYFWYPVDNFNVEHHVNYLNPTCPDEPVSIATLRRLAVVRNGQLPFDPSKSPWELILVPNLVDKNNASVKSAIYVRVNHCLMDGYAIVSFIQKVAEKPWKIDVANNALGNKQSSRKANAMIKKFLIFLKMFVTGPFYLVQQAFNFNDNNTFFKKIFTPSASKEDLSWALQEAEPRKIDGARLKRLRKSLSVTVSSLLLTMVSEGVIRFIKRRCEEGFCEKVPKTVCLNMSFPMPGHSGKMTNHWTTARMVIPVNKESDPTKTLRNVHEQYQNFKTSIVPLVNFVVSLLIGSLPVFMYPDLEKLVTQTITLTNFPGPAGKLDIFGYEWGGYGASGNFPVASAFLPACLNLHGKFWIDVGGVKSALPSQQDLNALEDHVHDVLHELESTVMPKLSSEDVENNMDVMNGNSF